MIKTTLYKYSGAGNTFAIIHSPEAGFEITLQEIIDLCSRDKGLDTDGFIILEPGSGCDFRMRFYNNDGSSGMMCGNGGRCIVDLADRLGIKPSGPDCTFIFEAPDGMHHGRVLSRCGLQNEASSSEPNCHHAKECGFLSDVASYSLVDISMCDVTKIEQHILTDIYGAEFNAYRMNTGTDHLVIFCNDLDRLDIIKEGRRWRYDEKFAPKGVNVNFVSNSLRMCTYEKGVEAETLACGTGVIAAALARHIAKEFENTKTQLEDHPSKSKKSRNDIVSTNDSADIHSCHITMGSNDFLVTFRPTSTGFTDIHLQGPVELLFVTG